MMVNLILWLERWTSKTEGEYTYDVIATGLEALSLTYANPIFRAVTGSRQELILLCSKQVIDLNLNHKLSSESCTFNNLMI